MGYDKPSAAEAKRIFEAIGIDVSGTQRFISDQRIIHSLNRHGVGIENREGQEPITKEDFEKIPEYVRTADQISIEGVTGQGLTVIRYQKRVNGHVVILEEHHRQKEFLDFGSMWKYRASK